MRKLMTRPLNVLRSGAHFYSRSVPERVRAIVPSRIRSSVLRWLGVELEIASNALPQELLEQAAAASRLEEWGLAATAWQSIVDCHQGAPATAFVQLSKALRMQDQHDKADSAAELGIKQWPQHLSLAKEYARIAMSRADWSLAVERWQSVIDKFGSGASTETYRQLHTALRLSGDNRGAAKFLKQYKSHLVSDYNEWIVKNDTLNTDDRELIRRRIAALAARPKFSILMPVYDTPTEYLKLAIDSVRSQLYEDWELCIVDDASTSSDVRDIIMGYAEGDSRVVPLFRDQNGGIAACTNSALALASGEWIVFMDHDDVLAEHALYMLAVAIERNPNARIIYSDEDHIDELGQRSNHHFKPDFNYELFLCQNMINHVAAYEASLARDIGGLREGFEGSQDWDFGLRAVEVTPRDSIVHIPFVLYHWRQTSQGFSTTSLERAARASTLAVNEHLVRTGQDATAAPIGRSSLLRIQRALPEKLPTVSVVVPTKDRAHLLETCIAGLLDRTDYQSMEIIVVDNGSSDHDALKLLQRLRSKSNVTVIAAPGPFNYSKLINEGVVASSGEVLVLLNNDIDVIKPSWLKEMVSYAILQDVGAVGAKLYFSNDTVQHGGVTLGIGGLAGHAFKHFPRTATGYMFRLVLAQEASCVTAACVATRRAVFDDVGGFNEHDLPVSFNDVEFCLRLRRSGYRIIWTPYAELYHYESLTRGSDAAPENRKRAKAEARHIKNVWGDVIKADPYYSPNLSLDSESFQLAERPRVSRPWLEDRC